MQNTLIQLILSLYRLGPHAIQCQLGKHNPSKELIQVQHQHVLLLYDHQKSWL